MLVARLPNREAGVTMSESGLSSMLDNYLTGFPGLERSLLRDQAIDLLRDHIVSGHIPPGTKLVEREVAKLLGISRAPARDALLELEKEGLIVTGPHGRHVIKLTERDVRELYQVRLALESLAVRLAAQNTCSQNQAALAVKLDAMRTAVAQGDRARHVAADVEMHLLVWKQARNGHLWRMLNSMVGPIFMFVANNADGFDWQETLALHQELVGFINSGDAVSAAKSIEQHLERSQQRALRVLQSRG